MKKPEQKTLKIVYEEFEAGTPLPEKEQMLVDAACDAAKKAYAPYSGFSVGAALLLEDNTMVLGNNQENAAYPSGLCAERVALFAAAAMHPNKAVTMLAVSALKDGHQVAEPVSPCGGCRQVFAEVEHRHGKPFVVLMAGANKIIRIRQSTLLLPFTFDSGSL